MGKHLSRVVRREEYAHKDEGRVGPVVVPSRGRVPFLYPLQVGSHPEPHRKCGEDNARRKP